MLRKGVRLKLFKIMTDREILDEVYRRLCGDDPHGYKTNPLKDGVRSFIEREWQKQDEAVRLDEELHDEMCRHDPWMNINEQDVDKNSVDVKDIERHRGLEIGPDGTVKELK